jgi:FkbM family methyltransferase
MGLQSRTRLPERFLRSTAVPALQPFWEKVHRMALMGLNYGAGYLHDESGELWVIEQLRGRAPGGEPLTVFDVGANEGQYTSSLLGILGEGMNIYSFEPSPRAFEVLSEKHGGHPSIRLFEVGLSDRDGEATLFSIDAGSMVSSLYHRRIEGDEYRPTETCQLRTLDGFCEEQGVRRIHHLKLDAEGNELKILLGAARMLEAGAIDQVQFEFGEAQVDSRTFLRDFFEVLGPRYLINRILHRGLRPLKRYDVVQEVYRNTNYLAVRRAGG